MGGSEGQVGLCEPLDGILSSGWRRAPASSSMKPWGSTSPGISTTAKYAGLAGVRGTGAFAGAWNSRLLSSTRPGAGLFGYFIGLSVLRPRDGASFCCRSDGSSAAALHAERGTASSSIFSHNGYIVVGCFGCSSGLLSLRFARRSDFQGARNFPDRRPQCFGRRAAGGRCAFRSTALRGRRIYVIGHPGRAIPDNNWPQGSS